MHGFLNINKPSGLTSHDVVAQVRRLVGRGVKVGHAGTLDPAAVGVLPMALGSATRLIEYLAAARKGYQGLVRLGSTTATDDTEGAILETRPVPPFTDAELEAAVAPLRGEIIQTPPRYAALRQGGRRLYVLARSGQTVEPTPRPVLVEQLTWQREAADLLKIDVVCGKGTYIRSLARDIGSALGCGAHLAALTRTFVEPFYIEAALNLATLQARPERLAEALLPPEYILAAWPAAHLDEALARRVANGMAVSLPPLPGDQARAHGPDGRLLAIIRRSGAYWQPEKVLMQ
ncbi:tRNA pseudouridine(55) synthase TruB [Candidatus Viridilinea mediisalina]|uniref:tRNA pseudouridine synthase B n=1 Tax=Candidatus Viridilinea mediisalina TaxID=2024553 RepID=A0A2A6RGD4_9CHLR|nr:tRNA pseudouridine(55) synthase TruB [Candidatus Viridilinea mediisalina]PDW02082.1 tRNA pseudouridine(55) synthase TruB [Candidatus Viridilinea mediisalina]